MVSAEFQDFVGFMAGWFCLCYCLCEYLGYDHSRLVIANVYELSAERPCAVSLRKHWANCMRHTVTALARQSSCFWCWLVNYTSLIKTDES